MTKELFLPEYFSVAFNAFTGTLPKELGSLTKLGMYIIRQCQTLFLLRSLHPLSTFWFPLLIEEFVNMRSSQIHGTIPSELGQLTSLGTGKKREKKCSYREIILCLVPFPFYLNPHVFFFSILIDYRHQKLYF